MTKSRPFTDIERAAMDAVEYFARKEGGAQWLVDQFGLGKRTAFRLVGKQQPPPVGIAEKIATGPMGDWCRAETTTLTDPISRHIQALQAFVQQRRSPKGGTHG